MIHDIKKRKLLVIVLIMLLLFSTSSMYATNINIDGSQVQFTQTSGYPFLDSASRTQVPLRITMESYGCEVNWNGETKTATVLKDGITVEVPIGAKYVIKNGVTIPNDTAAVLKDGRTYLPIRAVLEAFGALVEWNGATQTVMAYQGGADSVMHIHFIDVGQGDSIFIDYGEFEVLVDAGDNQYGDDVVSYIYPYVDGDLDVVIATHNQADHIGGLDEVINAFQVGTIIDSGSNSTSATWQDYFKAASEEPQCNYISDEDMTIQMGDGAYLYIIETGDNYNNENNNSVVSLIQYNNVGIALTGDMEEDVESTILSDCIDIDVLKAGHHGSNTSSSQGFLDATKPEVVIVSAGTNNQYGHPDIEAMQRFASIGATVYGTFKSGTIVMTTNGSSYSFNTATPITSSDAGAGFDSSNTTTIQTNTNVVTRNEAVYIGNSNTKKFHTLTCRYADTISIENVLYFKTRATAISQGYVPCKVCNP